MLAVITIELSTELYTLTLNIKLKDRLQMAKHRLFIKPLVGDGLRISSFPSDGHYDTHCTKGNPTFQFSWLLQLLPLPRWFWHDIVSNVLPCLIPVIFWYSRHLLQCNIEDDVPFSVDNKRKTRDCSFFVLSSKKLSSNVKLLVWKYLFVNNLNKKTYCKRVYFVAIINYIYS